MNRLLVAELGLKQAMWAEKAERLRRLWQTSPATSSTTISLAKKVRDAQKMADDYAEVLCVARELPDDSRSPGSRTKTEDE